VLGGLQGFVSPHRHKSDIITAGRR